MIIDIPGGTATLRDTISVGKRREIRRLSLGALGVMSKVQNLSEDSSLADLAQLEMQPDDAKVMFDVQDATQDATILAFLESWTLDQPLPTADTIGELDAELYDALAEGVNKIGVLGGVDTSVNPAKDSPTDGSPSSDSDSKDEPTLTSPLITSSSNGTESTVTESSIPV